MIENLKKLLEEIQETIDLKSIRASEARFANSLDYKPVDRLPLIISHPYTSRIPFKPFTVEETFDDPEKMLFNQFISAWDTSIYCRKWLRDDLPYTVRANFGTILIPSMLGCESIILGDNPPWVKNDENLDTFLRRTAELEFDPSNPFYQKVLDVYRTFRHVLSDYPLLQSVTHLVLPDLQGPLSNYEQMRGSAMYTDFYERPEVVHEVLSGLKNYQISLAHNLINELGVGSETRTFQHGHMIKGNILIRDDTLALVSGDIYREFGAVPDSRILRSLGGGGIHACGKFDHTIDAVLEVDHLTCIDLGQSQMNDMQMIYDKASLLKIPLIRVEITQEELDSELIKEKYPTGVTLRYSAKSLEEAVEAWKRYSN